MTSPLPPRLRDTRGSADLIRQLKQNGRQLDSGLVGGRWSPAKPLGATAQDGDLEDDDPLDAELVLGEDGDRLVLTSLATQPWTLSHIPIEGTLVVRWHPDGGAGVEWKRGEHYLIDDDTQVVIVTAAAFAAAGAVVGDVLSAQYLYVEGDDESSTFPLDALMLRGASLMVDAPSMIALPDGTEVGDLIVAVCASSQLLSSVPGDGIVTDPRLTKVGYATWVGIATDLNPVTYANPSGGRLTGAVATFEPPAHFQNAATAGPGSGGISTLAVPTVGANAAVMGFIEENRNGFGGTLDSWPTGYVKATADAGGTICKAYVLYWAPDGATSSPAGTVGYTAHVDGHTHVDVIGLQGEDE